MRVSEIENSAEITPPDPPQIQGDSRFTEPTFRASVRVVLEYLGLESNLGNFRKYDSRTGGCIRDWPLFAERISNPRFTAEVEIRGAAGQTVGVELFGATREEAICKLDTERYKFLRWF